VTDRCLLKLLPKLKVLDIQPRHIKAKFNYAIMLANTWAGLGPDRRQAANRSAITFELSRHVKIARIWSQTGLNLITDRFAAGLRPGRVADRFKLSQHVEIARTCSNLIAAGSRLVCDLL